MCWRPVFIEWSACDDGLHRTSRHRADLAAIGLGLGPLALLVLRNAIDGLSIALLSIQKAPKDVPLRRRVVVRPFVRIMIRGRATGHDVRTLGGGGRSW